MLLHTITEATSQEMHKLFAPFTFCQCRVKLTLDSSGMDFIFCIMNVSPLILFHTLSLLLFLIDTLSACSFSLSALYLPLFH